jgi:uncharacterized membrane protein
MRRCVSWNKDGMRGERLNCGGGQYLMMMVMMMMVVVVVVVVVMTTTILHRNKSRNQH